MDFEKAAALAGAWVDILCEGQARIMREATIAKPYGWIFFYQSNQYLDADDGSAVLVGNAPLIVDRNTGELRVTGTARPLEHYLAEYEKTLPPASLQRTPQPPTW
ncbi:YrhB domain-containing protein [Bradyrhizobium sp. CCBAU 65884]|uniref:YrhB domain-containing protein n=1 Tax=Bradyrhizobium sp. CCBAU 65884 TaxID=722477 RepID=UPI0023061F77|nr:YrhB domain-containing protein [Bradyrhizobium sp. CCBAU 65884]